MPLTITPSTIVKSVIFGLIPLVLLIGFFLTGYTYIPVEYSIGKCLKDYTNTTSYQNRTSELKSSSMHLDDAEILVCYGSPAAKSQNVYGDLIPYDSLWGFGAYEPTRLYTQQDIVLGEVVVPKGRYSIYAIPGRWKWEVFISTSTDHWGDKITDEVKKQEIGSFEVRPQYNHNYVKELTIYPSQKEIIAEWGKTRIVIPVENIDPKKDAKHTTILSKFRASLDK
ncbi:MAG: hypothetical protein BalsKO_18120 [Balneolaceae bacterium]